MTKSIGTVILLVALAACGGADCLALPCPLPMAVNLRITSAASGTPIDSATVTVTAGGFPGTPIPCDSACIVPGSAGSYAIQVSAPGFATTERTVNVTGSNSDCGCGSVDTQTVTIALAAAN